MAAKSWSATAITSDMAATLRRRWSGPRRPRRRDLLERAPEEPRRERPHELRGSGDLDVAPADRVRPGAGAGEDLTERERRRGDQDVRLRSGVLEADGRLAVVEDQPVRRPLRGGVVELEDHPVR